jgi:valyl-tRNA synthetase
VLARPEPVGRVTHVLDRGLLTQLAQLVEDATRALDGYDYARALQHSETFFWSLCDNYLEMVKSRRYGDHGPEAAGSANATLLCALSVLNRMFALYLPFVTEEVWSWWQPGSVHASQWPTVDEISRLGPADREARAALDKAIEVLAEIRRIRSGANKSPKVRLTRVRVQTDAATITQLRALEVDLRSAAAADRFEFVESDSPVLDSRDPVPDAPPPHSPFLIDVEFASEAAPPSGEARE